MHGADKENVNDKGDRKVKNELLYGFKAYKGYFVLGDYLVALGAGVTNNCRIWKDTSDHIGSDSKGGSGLSLEER